MPIIMILQLIGTCIGIFVTCALVTTYIEAGDQQAKDWRRYRIRSTRWQIMLEIWGIREVK